MTARQIRRWGRWFVSIAVGMSMLQVAIGSDGIWRIVGLTFQTAVLVAYILLTLRLDRLELQRTVAPSRSLSPMLDDMSPWNGSCPDCGSKEFLEGPRGGLCVNIQCTRCATRLNVAQIPGHLLSQRIESPLKARKTERSS